MAGNEQYDDYCQEVAQAVDNGDVSRDVQQVLQQIEQVDQQPDVSQQDIYDVSTCSISISISYTCISTFVR